jgi:hypothetical protein
MRVSKDYAAKSQGKGETLYGNMPFTSCKSEYHTDGEYETPYDSLEGDMYPENGINWGM